MKNSNFLLASAMVLLLSMLSSCAIVGGIFKAGVWFGILIVIVVIVVIAAIIMRSTRK